MSSLLGQMNPSRLRASGSLTNLVVSPLRMNVVPFRVASVQASQKRTLEKYGNRASKSGKKGDFLSNAKSAQQGKDKKKGAVAGKEGGEGKFNMSGGSAGGKAEIELDDDAEMEDVEDSSMNQEFDWPNFTLTEQKYEEYEANEPNPEEESVTDNQVKEERAAYIKRLWEPYETESFNLKALIGDSPPSGEIVKLHEKDDKPSKMFYYSEEEVQKYLPEGISGKINKTFNWPGFKQKAVLVRPVVEDVISWMENWRNKQFIGRRQNNDFYTILNGPMGCGKSALLNPIVHFARLNGWLVLYVPDGKDWAGFPRKKSGIEKMLSYSKVNETWFGQPYLATNWITALMKAHGDKLEKIHLKTEFTVRDVDPDKPTYTSSPEHTLKTLLDYALQHPQQASDCIWYLRQEISAVTEYPVLIVVDGVNAIRGHSKYGDPIDPYIFAPNLDTSRLVLTRAFQEYRNHGLANGLYVGAMSGSANMQSVKVRRSNPDLRRTRYDLDPSLSITKVPALSLPEAHLLSQWYRENDVFAGEVPTQTVDYMWAMSQGNGDIFWKQAESI